MKTTLQEIREESPCEPGWKKLITTLGRIKGDVTLKQILDSNGIADAVWCLRVFSYKQQCLFRAEVAETVLPIFNERYPNDDRPRQAIEAIKKWHSDGIDDNELALCALDTYDYAAAHYAARATHYAIPATAAAAYAASSYAATAAYYAAATVYYASSAPYAVSAAYYAVSAATYATSYYAVPTDTAREDKWKEIEVLFIKYFCKGDES